MSNVVNDQVREVEMGMLYVTPGVILEIKSVEVFAAHEWIFFHSQEVEEGE